MTERSPFSAHLSRLSKLRAMSAPEVVHRLRYSLIVSRERRQHAAGRLAPSGRLSAALNSEFRHRDWARRLTDSRRQNRHRFFVSVRQPEAMRRLFATTYRDEHASTVRHATEARHHRFEFFGEHFSYPEAIEWQCDPVSGTRWPDRYHADVRVHGGNVGYGDVKHVWELSRQQFLIDLAKAWSVDRSPEDLDALRALVSSWIAGNPYATGVNWSCALEPAFRVFSWLWAYYLTIEDLDEPFHLEWLQAFYDHARFIERHLERYSSPYNHLIAEAAALFMLGKCFPEFAEAERWQESGRAVLEGRLAQQFYADGGSVEQSTFYHHATVGFYLLAAVLARATGDALSPRVWEAIERGIEFSMRLSQPDGRTPSIGGADDGKPIRMEHLPFWDFRPYQAMGAVLFGRADFKQVAGRFHEDALWLLGPGGLDAFNALDTQPPRETSVALAASGYYILRSDWSERADYACFDCGEQAAGMRTDSVPNSMHGHADCLSVVVSLRGRRVLVDSGLYAYNCGGAWEAHFRETAAHSTAKVDGRDQAKHLGKMAWSDSYRATPEGWHATPAEAWVVGSHDGYERGTGGVRHRRAVWLRPGSYLLLYDEFVGSGGHALTVNYQFAPGALALTGAQRALFEETVEVAWVSGIPWSAAIACGGDGPEAGWIAPSLGVREAAPRLTLTGAMTTGRVALLTVIAAQVGVAGRIVDFAHDNHAEGLVAVLDHEFADCIAAAGISPSHPIDTEALIAVCRVAPDGLYTSSIADGPVAVDESALRVLLAGRALAVPAGQ